MKKRALKYIIDDKLIPIIEKRYPNENTRSLADDLGLEYEALHGYAQRIKLRKTKEFKRNLGTTYGKLSKSGDDYKIPPIMAGADRRNIHSGLLLTKGNILVHIATG